MSSRTLENFEAFDPENIPRGELSALEVLVPELASARTANDLPALIEAKNLLLQSVLESSGQCVLIEPTKRGKRYLVLVAPACYIKILVSDGRFSVFPPDRPDLERLMIRHRLEHAAICHYFDDQVPDTLFYPSPIEPNNDNPFAQAMSTRPFLLQEGVKDGIPVQEGFLGPVAETVEFRRQLEKLLGAFVRMGEELELVPDVPTLQYPNILVDSAGYIKVVDTNTLVPPSHYHRFGFDFIEEVERMIRDLERGLVRGNPQG